MDTLDISWSRVGLDISWSRVGPWILHGYSMEYPWIVNGLSMDYQLKTDSWIITTWQTIEVERLLTRRNSIVFQRASSCVLQNYKNHHRKQEMCRWKSDPFPIWIRPRPIRNRKGLLIWALSSYQQEEVYITQYTYTPKLLIKKMLHWDKKGIAKEVRQIRKWTLGQRSAGHAPIF